MNDTPRTGGPAPSLWRELSAIDPPARFARELSALGKSPISPDERRALALLCARLFDRPSEGWILAGRYRVGARLGSGATGVVYRGHDPKLRRDVAIKVLRRQAEGGPLDRRGVAQLLREGQALARLHHPGIVQVYDVGEQSEPQLVFVVMELVEGSTLRKWLDLRPRASWSDVVAPFRECATALVAAHEAGVLHRDFKPHNVVVGADGRARVLDFGGLGTPQYMSPEQACGDPLDARADVYSWSAALKECLGDLPRPQWVDAALQAGMEPQREDRPATMRALLQRFEPKRRPHLARAVAVGLLAWVIASLVVTRPDPCPTPAPLEGVDGLPPDLSAQVDRFARRWSEAVATSCDAPVPVRVRASSCLERVRARWKGTREALQRHAHDPQAALVVDGLPLPDECLTEPPTTEPAAGLRERWAYLFAQIGTSRSFNTWAEDGPSLLRQLRELQEAGAALGDDWTQGRAGLVLGSSLQWEMRLGDAELQFIDAHAMALRAGDHDVAFEAAQNMVQLRWFITGNAEDGGYWVEQARRAVERLGTDDGRGKLHRLQGNVAKERRNFETALRHYDAAEELYDDDTSEIAWQGLLMDRGYVYAALGRADEAVADYLHALDRFEDLVGVDTMEIVGVLNGLGVALRVQGRYVDAAVYLERALRTLTVHAPESPDIMAVRGNLAQLYADQGLHERALPEFEAVREALEVALGVDRPVVAETSAAIAQCHYELGNYTEAAREATKALAGDLPEMLREDVARLAEAATRR